MFKKTALFSRDGIPKSVSHKTVNNILSFRANGPYHNHVFTNRPVSVDEKICFEIVKTGVYGIVLGFSAVDPGELAGQLPENSNGNPEFFTKYVDKKLCKKGSTIDYHLTSSGEVMYRVNGEEKGVLFSVGKQQTLLWGMVYPLEDYVIKLIHSN